MPKINVLPKSVAELIAAGEVVERPSSVVKELIENSIDAGADSITVEIRSGGVKYIRVTDNGCGISPEDVRTAFISHATSKISSGEDLDSIFTLGFRGEALPSVAAVSRLSMLTRTENSPTGISFEIEGGEEKSFDEAGCPKGTTIMIRDLFYNTPARMKFLKKDMTEGTYVSDIVAKTAISHPGIKFILIKDGKQVLMTPGNGDLKSTVYAVFGKDISEGLIECEYEHKSIKVKGFISKPLNNRPNRNMQYCFVNGRYVRIPAAAAALDEAYKNRIMVGKFPMCFLFVDIPPGKIDVNVHPAKTEIRFSEDSSVFEAIYYSAKTALNKGDIGRPEVVLREKRDLLQKKIPESAQLSFSSGKMPSSAVNTSSGKDLSQREEIAKKTVEENYPRDTHDMGAFCDNSGVFRNLISREDAEKSNLLLREEQKKRVEMLKNTSFEEIFPKSNPAKSISQENISQENISQENASRNNAASESSVLPEEEIKENIPCEDSSSVCEKAEPESSCEEKAFSEEVSFRIIGEVFRTYILVEAEGKLLIIDKHASHERIIYNRLRKRGFGEASQMLMFPVSVSLSGKEYAAVTENIDVFAKGGFTVEDFGGGTVIVRDSPVTLEKTDVASVITEMAGELARGNLRPVPEKLDWLYHSTACRAAVKAGDEMKEQETYALVKMLLSDPSIRYCPHGRPVMYELSKHEIEKQFGRI